jgi:autotransporter passenger strand-loop-strand repeat protein
MVVISNLLRWIQKVMIKILKVATVLVFFTAVSMFKTNFVSAACTPVVGKGQIVKDEVISSDEVQKVMNGGKTINVTIDGGCQYVCNGGCAIDTKIKKSGFQSVDCEGEVSNTTIDCGGVQDINCFGISLNTTINGGFQNVNRGGSAINTKLNKSDKLGDLCSGCQFIRHGGSANGVIVNKGNLQLVSGGVARGTIINDGGTQIVNEDGLAMETMINFGGQQVIQDKSSTSVNATVNKGGLLKAYHIAGLIGLKIKTGGKVSEYDRSKAVCSKC